MKVFFIPKKIITTFATFFTLTVFSIICYSFAKSEPNVEYPYFNQKDVYSSKEKIAYLTFDDGPNNNVTLKVLDILKKENIKANFFVIGKHEYPEVTKLIYENGHFIGNHTYSHNNNIIYKNKETFFNEIKQTDIAIGNAIGISDFCSHVFRCPNGSMSKINYSKKQECLRYLPEISYTFVDWNVLNNDSMRKYSKTELVNNLKKSSLNKGSIIILMHDSGDVNKTFDALEDSISYLKEQGYEFRTFYDFVKNGEKGVIPLFHH